MKKTTKLFMTRVIATLLLIFTVSINTHAQTIDEVYDLSFKSETAFTPTKTIGNFVHRATFNIDQGNPINGKNPLKIGYFEMQSTNPTYNNMEIEFSRFIVLPDQKKSTYEVVLNARNRDIEDVVFTVIALDKDENNIGIDSIKINASERKEYALTLTKLQAKALQVKIECNGNDKKSQALWLDKITIKADGKEINNLPAFADTKTIDLPYKNKLITAKETLYDRSALKNKKIIGLGESVSGSMEIQEVGYSMLKNMIEKEGCQLIVMDDNADEALFTDLYIQGAIGDYYKTKMEQIARSASLYNYNDFVLRLAFIEWLREYNQTAENKVHWTGINMSFDPKSCLFHFFRVILDKDHSNEYLKKAYNKEFSELYQMASTDDILRKKLGAESTEYLLSVIKECTVKRKDTERDENMFRRFNNAFNTYIKDGELAVIKAPAITLSKGEMFYGGKKAGYYLAQTYKNSYYNIDLVLGEGEHKSHANNTIELTQAPGISVEGLFGNMGQTYCFYPGEYLPHEVSMIRMTDRYYKLSPTDFIFCSPKKEFDAFVFISKSTATENIQKNTGLTFGPFDHQKDQAYLKEWIGKI